MRVIKIENITSNIVKVTVPETLKDGDFLQLTPKADAFIRKYGKIRLLVDASGFNGWENTAAFEKHMGFVKAHQKSVERGALIAGHAWQHWVAGVFKIFVHPEIRVFAKDEGDAALAWIREEKRLSA
jgi:hypothetical protein